MSRPPYALRPGEIERSDQRALCGDGRYRQAVRSHRPRMCALCAGTIEPGAFYVYKKHPQFGGPRRTCGDCEPLVALLGLPCAGA